jgi:hypothetical protein
MRAEGGAEMRRSSASPEEQLRTEMTGKTLAQVAEAHGDARPAEGVPHRREREARAVADGLLTADRGEGPGVRGGGRHDITPPCPAKGGRFHMDGGRG